MFDKKAHRIQLVGLVERNSQFSLIRLGLVIIQDRDHVTFNPSIPGYNNLRWTWHKNGLVTLKENGKILQHSQKQRLDKFKKCEFWITENYPIQGTNLGMNYDRIDQSQIYIVDLRNYKDSHFNISIFLTSYHSIPSCCQSFPNCSNHQVFVYMKSIPYLVISFFGLGRK